MNTVCRFVGIITLLVMFPVIVSAAIIRVPADQPTIQAGIDVAVDGDTVLVADGTYTGDGNRDIDYKGKAITVASENGAENCIIDCETSGRGFLFSHQETSASQLIGFTIQNGYGGALNCENQSSPKIFECIFSDNSSMDGGAIFCNSSSPEIRNCQFYKNYSSQWGAGISLVYSSCDMSSCTFLNNISDWGGGGIDCRDSCIHVDSCTFESNTAKTLGGAADVIFNSTAEFSHCIFNNNFTEEDGGAIYIFTKVESAIGVTVTNSSFIRNRSQISGGAISIYFTPTCVIGGSPDTSNSFLNNWSPAGADLFYSSRMSEKINAQYNNFSGYYSSDYYVTPQESFNLEGSRSSLEPIIQDVYVSPDGNDNNDGLSVDNPFKTLQYAMSRIYGSLKHPISVHLSTGVFSALSTGEYFPIPILSNVSLLGANKDRTILDAENRNTVLVTIFDKNVLISDINIKNGWSDLLGGGIYCFGSEARIQNCSICNNYSYLLGGGLFIEDSNPLLEHCQISNNHSNEGGGLYCRDSSPLISNCIIISNRAERDFTIGIGAGIFSDYYSCPKLTNCTVSNNFASDSGGGVFIDDAGINISNSIFAENVPSELQDFFYHVRQVEVTFSDFQGIVVPGIGNISSDPNFISGDPFDYHLSPDSPCIDAGTDNAGNDTDFDGNPRPQGGAVDMGAYEFPGWPSITRAYVKMPSQNLKAGDTTFCAASVWNPFEYSLDHHKLFVLLVIYNQIFMAPSFSDFDYYTWSFDPGKTDLVVLPEFSWPYNAGSATDVVWYAFLTNPEMTALASEIGVFDFGWSE